MPIPNTAEKIHAAIRRLNYWQIAQLVHEWLHPQPPPGSVRVRIAVGMSSEGEWSCVPCVPHDEEWALNELNTDGYGRHIIFVEADIPPPEPEPVVQGRVVG
ncbi:MAG: hypothetical protein KGL39_30395 [Patescibacteria group bacterium]|nr:hypothetical protein [Patescibacteria group bacterium]